MILASVFGIARPCVAQINRDEEVVFYGPYLYWDDVGNLVLVMRGRLFELERNSVARRVTIDRAIRPLLFQYIGKRPTEFDQKARARMVERLLPFLVDGESREELKLRLVGRGDSAVLELPSTNAGGHFALATSAVDSVAVKDLVGVGDELHATVLLPERDKRQFAVRLRVPPPTVPLLVISDVDDTVRIAEVVDRPRMIERVFLHPYEVVPGMSDIYKQLAQGGAEFHFVSGSPWQIARLIEGLLADEGFPPAVLHCRQLSWDFWNSDPVQTKEFKIATIETLLKQFRCSKVLMIGDDGEHDPEVYSQILRAHRERVVGIWIRHVSPQSSEDRLKYARDELGEKRAIIFDDSMQLRRAVAEIEAGLLDVKP